MNVRTIKHYPPEMISPMLSTNERGPEIATELAATIGVESKLTL